MKTLPEILIALYAQGGLDYSIGLEMGASVDVASDNQMRHVKKSAQSIAKELMGVIGEDDEAVRGSTQSPDNPKYWTKKTAHRNELRAEQRARLTAFIGKEK